MVGSYQLRIIHIMWLPRLGIGARSGCALCLFTSPPTQALMGCARLAVASALLVPVLAPMQPPGGFPWLGGHAKPWLSRSERDPTCRTRPVWAPLPYTKRNVATERQNARRENRHGRLKCFLKM